jgi:hypothetical protein
VEESRNYQFVERVATRIYITHDAMTLNAAFDKFYNGYLFDVDLDNFIGQRTARRAAMGSSVADGDQSVEEAQTFFGFQRRRNKSVVERENSMPRQSHSEIAISENGVVMSDYNIAAQHIKRIKDRTQLVKLRELCEARLSKLPAAKTNSNSARSNGGSMSGFGYGGTTRSKKGSGGGEWVESIAVSKNGKTYIYAARYRYESPQKPRVYVRMEKRKGKR